MILLRFKKVAIKKNLSYSIVVSPLQIAPTSNKFVEKVGFYKPIIDRWSNKYAFIEMDRLFFWLKRGAKINKSLFLLIKPLIVYLIQNKNV